MNAKEIMSTPVITITPHTPVRRIAALLDEHHISGVPVVDDGKVIGIVNESELLRRFEIGTEDSEPKRSWLDKLLERDLTALAYVRSHSQRAVDVMQRDVVAVAEETSVQRLAAILGERAVRRIVVLRGEKLVGIVTRASLIRALKLQTTARANGSGSDEAILTTLLDELAKQPWWRPNQSSVTVCNGVVRFQGLVENDDERRAARAAAENIPGVHTVDDLRRHWAYMNSSY
ncbi:MAG: CBS domain-containing protein [Ideonella sp.]